MLDWWYIVAFLVVPSHQPAETEEHNSNLRKSPGCLPSSSSEVRNWFLEEHQIQLHVLVRSRQTSSAKTAKLNPSLPQRVTQHHCWVTVYSNGPFSYIRHKELVGHLSVFVFHNYLWALLWLLKANLSYMLVTTEQHLCFTCWANGFTDIWSVQTLTLAWV